MMEELQRFQRQTPTYITDVKQSSLEDGNLWSAATRRRLLRPAATRRRLLRPAATSRRTTQVAIL